MRTTLCAVGLVLAGCGGGGGYAGVSPFPQETSSPAPATSSSSTGSTSTGATSDTPSFSPLSAAEGFYNGTLTSASTTTYDFSGVILENGTIWGLYAKGGVLYGVVKGQSLTTANGGFSGGGKDLFLPSLTVSNLSFSGSVTPKSSVSGTVSNGSTFSGNYDASYETPANAADAVGHWSGQVLSPAGLQTATVNVNADGSFQGSVAGCSYDGTIHPRASGKNVFDTNVTFHGGTCLFGKNTLTGISIISSTGGTRALVTAALLPDGSAGFLSAGTH